MAVRHASTFRYRWPVLLLLLIEALALVWVAALDKSLPPLSTISIVAAAIALAVGIAPLLLRPSPTTQLGSCMIVVLAAFILVPVRPGMVVRPAVVGALLTAIPAYALYRLINGAFFVALAYQVAGHFPIQAAPGSCPRPTQRAIAEAYLIMALLLVALLLVPLPPLRVALFVATMGWIYLLVGRALWRLACLSRDPSRANGQARQQARVLLFSALVAAIPSLLLNVTEYLVGAPIVRADFAAFFLLLFPLGTAYAILRHDLLIIDGAARRALAYTTLSALALLVYFVVTLLLTMVVLQRWPAVLRIVGPISVLTATLLFATLQQQVQQLVDRWLYPERRTFLRAIRAARHRLGTVVERQAVIELLTNTLPAQIGAEWAVLTLAPAPLTLPPQNTPPAWSGTLTVGESTVGRYWLASRQTLPRYEADEESQLRQLLQEAALVLAYDETIAALRQLNEELETRVAERTAQLVTQQRALAAHEQRQQLARDLHDSVTQSLFSLNLSLRAIRKVGERDPHAAVAELAAQEASAQLALTEMRALLTQLRSHSPEEENGEEEERAPRLVNLVEQLQALCNDLIQGGQLQVVLDTPPALLLSASVAQELHYIVREALHNVYKHSGQAHATVTLMVVNKRLLLKIHDPGQGIDWVPSSTTELDAADHHGLRGMQERASQLGGRLEITSAPLLGTTITLEMPLVNERLAPRA